eukprot:gene9060-11098_t
METPSIVDPSTATTNTNNNEIQLIAPNIRVEKVIDVFEETRIYFLFYIFKQPNSPIFIWVGDTNSQCTLDSLIVSMKTPMDPVPATTDILQSSGGSNENSSLSIAKRIVLKFKVQAFLSYNMSQDIPMMNQYIEKKLFQLLNSYLSTPTSTSQ